MGVLRTMGMVMLLEKNSLYPYVGDWFVANHRWVANHQYGFPFKKEYTFVVLLLCWGSVCREP